VNQLKAYLHVSNFAAKTHMTAKVTVLTLATLVRGARYLTGENLGAGWAEFSTLSSPVLFQSNVTARHANSHL